MKVSIKVDQDTFTFGMHGPLRVNMDFSYYSNSKKNGRIKGLGFRSKMAIVEGLFACYGVV